MNFSRFVNSFKKNGQKFCPMKDKLSCAISYYSALTSRPYPRIHIQRGTTATMSLKKGSQQTLAPCLE